MGRESCTIPVHRHQACAWPGALGRVTLSARLSDVIGGILCITSMIFIYVVDDVEYLLTVETVSVLPSLSCAPVLT